MTGKINRHTIVFAYDNDEQRKSMMSYVIPLAKLDEGLRVTALSTGNDVARIFKIEEAIGRYSDIDDLKGAIESLINTDTPETWTFADYEATQE